jgi:uncharacterized membrane protein YgcG
MSHKLTAMLAGTVLTVAVATLVAGPASAVPSQVGADCDAVVADTSGRLTESEQADVTAAAAELASAQRAVVRVRVADTLPDASPEAYLADALRACPSWTGQAKRRAPRLIAVIVGVDDRRTGLLYGNELHVLDRSEASIQSDVMNPRFADGDLAGGLDAGLAAINDAIEHPNSTVDEPAGPSTPFPWRGFGIAAGLLALLAGAVAAAFILVGRHKRGADNRAQLAALAGRRTELASNVYSFDAVLATLRDELLVAAPNPDDNERLLAEHQHIADDFAALTIDLAALDIPGRRNLTDDTLDTFDTELGRLETRYNNLHDQLNTLAATGVELSQFNPADRTLLDERATHSLQVTGDIDTAREAGFNVDSYNAAIDDANQHLADAGTALGLDQRFTVRDALTACDTSLEQASGVAGLEGRFNETETCAAGLEASTSELERRLAQARQLLDDLAGKWAASALTQYTNDADTVESELTAVRDTLGTLRIERATYTDTVADTVAGLDHRLAQAAEHLDSVDGAPDALADAAATAARLAQEAEDRRGQVEAHRYTRDIDDSSLLAYTAMMAAGRPDPFEAQRLAHDAHDEAEQAWTSAESARRAAEYSSSSSTYGGGSSSDFGSSSGGSSSSWDSGGFDSGGGSSSSW